MAKKTVLDFKYDYVDNVRGEELVKVGKNDSSPADRKSTRLNSSHQV